MVKLTYDWNRVLEPKKCRQIWINTSYLTDSYIGFTLKIESVFKNTIFGLKRMVKRGEEFQKYFF